MYTHTYIIIYIYTVGFFPLNDPFLTRFEVFSLDGFQVSMV